MADPTTGGFAAEFRDAQLRVLALRRQLDARLEQPPTEPFAALEVQVREGWHLLALSHVREVVRIPRTDALLESPPWVLGTFRYAGSSTPLIDLGWRLMGDPTALTLEHRVVVLELPMPLGFLVDSVGSVRDVDPDSLEPPSAAIPAASFLLASLPREGAGAYNLLSIPRVLGEFVVTLD